MNTKRRLILLASTFSVLALPMTAPFAQDKHAHGHGGARDLGTAAAFDKDGRLWVVTKETANAEQYVVLQSSTDMGKTWTSGVRIQQTPEPIAASGEARPHIAIGNKGEI